MPASRPRSRARVAPETTGDASSFIPPDPTLDKLRAAARRCTACPLAARATQAVFGEGPARAKLMLVGETPGDREDLEGRPFVGPAGRLLDRCLIEAGIERDEAYVTNVVKHFKWTQRGKRRLHGKPTRAEIKACRPWYEAELALVRPKVLVLLGATAAQATLGADFRVTRQRGEFIRSPLAPYVLATVHPSALLRTDPALRAAEIARFVEDLRKAARVL
jgi:DNA polymerase